MKHLSTPQLFVHPHPYDHLLGAETAANASLQVGKTTRLRIEGEEAAKVVFVHGSLVLRTFF